VRSGAQKVNQIGRVMKRVGDNGAVCESQRCERLSVDLAEQARLR
jgi:hypothetical protein